MAEYHYVDLMVSLPHLRNPFVSEQTPISRVQLANRLTMLQPEDRQILSEISHVQYWGELESTVPEAELLKRAELLRRQTDGRQLWEWVQWRLDVRFLMAALRLRRDQADAPDPILFGAYSRYALNVQRHWGHATFQLEGRFPWLKDVVRYLEEQNAVALEKVLLQEVWRYYSRRTLKVQYGLDAVVLYIGRWDLVDRWTGYRKDLARVRFDNLLQASLTQAQATLEQEGHL
jgi:hypothetical protein